MRIFVWSLCFLPAVSAMAQKKNHDVITRQCSAIRELVYAAATNHFEPIMMDQVRGSAGYQRHGTWEFSTTRFNTSMMWQGANTAYLEHYEEHTDSTHQDTWQYIAEYSHVPDVLEAEKLFTDLNNEIEGCSYPVNDSIEVSFIPLAPERLPKDRPASLEIAKLYELPLPEMPDTTQGAIMVMVGMERRSKDYRVSLIVENSVR